MTKSFEPECQDCFEFLKERFENQSQNLWLLKQAMRNPSFKFAHIKKKKKKNVHTDTDI